MGCGRSPLTEETADVKHTWVFLCAGLLLATPDVVPARVFAADAAQETRFRAAEQAREAGDYPEAYRLLSELVQQAPGNEAFNFSYGLTCLAMGNASRAELAFQRALLLNPGNHRARLELARALTATRRYAEARRELETVLAADPPLRVRRNVEAYLGRVRALEGRSGSVRIQTEIGVFHDSNVNAGPDTDVIFIQPRVFGFLVADRLRLGEQSAPKEDYGVFGAGRLAMEFDPGRPGGWLGEIGALVHANALREEHDFRLAYAQLHAAMRRQQGANSWRMPAVRYTHIQRGGKDLMRGASLAASCSRILSSENAQRVALHAEGQWREYPGRTGRDGFYAYTGVAFDQFVGPQRHAIGIGITGYRDFAEARIYEKTGWRTGIHGTLRLPHRIAMYGRAHYSIESFREKEPLAPDDRQDTQTQAVVGARKRIGKRWTLDAHRQTTRNHSTFRLYQHRRTVTTVGLTCVF